MKIQVDLQGRKRKELAESIGSFVGEKPIYKGAPSYAYEVGRFVIERDASITLAAKTRFTATAERNLLEALKLGGFKVEGNDLQEKIDELAPELPEEEPTGPHE